MCAHDIKLKNKGKWDKKKKTQPYLFIFFFFLQIMFVPGVLSKASMLHFVYKHLKPFISIFPLIPEVESGNTIA